MKKNTNTIRGYALLFAVLVSAIVLGVGVSILNIARKEILLTSGAQQSQYAFYAADAGYECALYQDQQQKVFPDTGAPSYPSNMMVQCGPIYSGNPPIANGLYTSPVTYQLGPITKQGTTITTTEYDYDFNIPVSAAGSCAAVNVKKFVTDTDTGNKDVNGNEIYTLTASTTVLSDGFNVGAEGFTSGGTGDCNASNDTKVERALLANY